MTLEDKVHLPLLYISYPTVSLGDPQEPALDMFADVLGGSASSMLYQSLVKSGKAIDAGASHYCEELACTLTVYAYPNPAVDGSLKTLKSEVDKVIGEFAGRGLKPEDLEKAINSYRASAIWGLDSVSGKVSQLAMGQVFAQDPNYVFKSLDAIGKVTPEQVKTAYDKFILNKPAVVLSVVPKGKSDWQAAKPNFTPAKRELPDYAKHDQVLAERPVKDDFDRSVQPKAADAVSVKVPAIWHGKLDKGIEIIGTQSDEIPAVSIMVALPGGMRAEGKGELGLASLTASMMGQGLGAFDRGPAQRRAAKARLQRQRLQRPVQQPGHHQQPDRQAAADPGAGTRGVRAARHARSRLRAGQGADAARDEAERAAAGVAGRSGIPRTGLRQAEPPRSTG